MADQLVIRGRARAQPQGHLPRPPRDSLIVFTGLSGSGKSSLAFDTIFAEGQRRYVESLSAYARQFLGQMDKPDVDFIEGLSPAVSIDQKSTSKNPRSTVGTITEVYDYLRLLYARAGRPHCPVCGSPIERQTPQQIVDRVLQLDEGTRFQVLAPVIRGRKGEYVELFRSLQSQGFSRARVNGETIQLAEPPKLEKQKKHTIEVVVDRLAAKASAKRRLTDSVETALDLASGLVIFDLVDARHQGPSRRSCGSRRRCRAPTSTTSTPTSSSRARSRSTPRSAPAPSATASAPGWRSTPTWSITDPGGTLGEGVIQPWSGAHVSDYFIRLLGALGDELGFDLNTPWQKLPAKGRTAILQGHPTKVHVRHTNRYGRERSYWTNFEGVIPYIERRHARGRERHQPRALRGLHARGALPGLRGHPPQAGLDGRHHRRPAARAGRRARQEHRRGLRACRSTRRRTTSPTSSSPRASGRSPSGCSRRSRSGCASCSTSGSTTSRSTGPRPPCRAGRPSGSGWPPRSAPGLVGVLYVLDEPSIGLHQRDNQRLIETLVRLKNLGNTLIVVEHDEDTIKTADWVVDIGPGAGEHGGQVVHSGTVKQLLKHRDSETGLYLSGRKSIPVPAVRRPRTKTRMLTVHGARENNLKDIDVSFPLGCFVAVTGVSGSGKSTLVNDILYTALAKRIYNARTVPGRHRKLTGTEHVDKVIHVDQSPIGRTPRSNPATYTGVFDHVRKLFASTPEAKMRGYLQGRFSFNVKGGRCEACSGDGTIKIEMNFLPDVYVPCEVCHGARYNRETLEVHYKGKTIADVLDMPIEEAVDFFAAIPAISRHLTTLMEVGPRLRPARPARHHAVRRGGPARQAGQRAAEAQHRQHGLRARRADHGPALRGHPQAARRALQPGRQGQHGAGDRAQPRRDQDRRLDRRHGSGRRQPRRHRRGRGHPGGRRGPRGQLHRRVPRAAAASGSRNSQETHSGRRTKVHRWVSGSLHRLLPQATDDRRRV